MRGHEQVIAMRRQGVRPESVHIWCGNDGLAGWKDWHENTPRMADVELPDSELLSGLDLRFTVGLMVFVNGRCPFRVAAVHAGCLAAGARRVLSASVQYDPQRPNIPAIAGRVLDSAEVAA